MKKFHTLIETHIVDCYCASVGAKSFREFCKDLKRKIKEADGNEITMRIMEIKK